MKALFNQAYPFKHWLVTIILGPILFSSFEINRLMSFMELYIMIFSYGALLSLPAFLIYLFAFSVLNKTKLSPLVIKVILTAGTTIGIFVTLYVLLDALFSQIGISYVVPLVLSSFFFKLRVNKNQAVLQADA